MVDARRPVGAFRILERIGSPEELVLELPDPAGERLAVLARPTADALVLGSTQRLLEVDAAAAAAHSLQLLRRRSGGGAVLVRAAGQVWLDLYIPSNDPAAHNDVGRAALVVGELWQAAIADALHLPPGRLAVHRGALVSARFSGLVCFAGLGPGEVTIDGQKVVGLSQRRDRAGAWFFTLAHLAFDAELHSRLFPSLGAAAQEELAADLHAHVAQLDAKMSDVTAALLAQLC